MPIVSFACAGELTDEEKTQFRNAGARGTSTGAGGTSAGAAGSGGPGGSGGGSSLDLCVVPLFKTRTCSIDGCHGGMPVQAGLVLTETVLTQPGPLLVDKPNMGVAVGGCEPSMFKLIDSAEPEKSLIYTKLIMPPCGSKMPVVPPYLTATEAACVLSWITSIPGVGPGGGSGAGGAGGSSGASGAAGAGGAGGAAGTGSSGAAGRGGAAGSGGTTDAGRSNAADSARGG